MTDCPNGEVRDLLPDLLHDRLAPERRQVVEAHVRTCADCQAELALLRDMRGALRAAPRVDVAAIAAAIPPYRAPAHRSWGGWRVAAGIMLLAAGGTSVALLQQNVGSADSPSVAVAPTAQPSRSDSVSPSVSPAPASVAPHELAMAGGAIGDLDDGELSALLKDIQSIDVLPSADVEGSTLVSPVSPTGTD